MRNEPPLTDPISRVWIGRKYVEQMLSGMRWPLRISRDEIEPSIIFGRDANECYLGIFPVQENEELSYCEYESSASMKGVDV